MNPLDAVALVALAVFQSSTAPFFSNDLAGTLKVLGVFGTMLGTMITLVVKLTQGRYTEKIKELETTIAANKKELEGIIDGLGGRVTDANANCTRLSEAQRQHEITLGQHTIAHGSINVALGELRATVGENAKNAGQLHHESMQTWLESAARINENVTAVRLDVRELQTTNRLGESLGALARAVEKRQS